MQFGLTGIGARNHETSQAWLPGRSPDRAVGCQLADTQKENRKTMKNFTDKRKYRRIELDERKYKEIVSPCIARFRVKYFGGHEMPPPDWNIVAVKNLSAEGIKFNYYNANLEIGSPVEVKIEFIKSMPTISCKGRVVRIEDAYVNSMFRIDVNFTEIDDEEREIINTTVEAILRKEKSTLLTQLK